MKRLFKILGIVVALVIVAAVALPFLIDPNQFRPLLESRLSEALGRTVKVGDLKLALFEGSVTAGDLSIGEDPAFGTEPFVKAQALHAEVELKPLIFSRKLNVVGVTLEKPAVRLVLSDKGQWNFSSLNQKKAGDATTPTADSSGTDLAIQLVKINDGQFTLVRAGQKTETFDDIDVELKDLSATSAVSFLMTAKRAAGGSVKVQGKAGPLGANDAGLPPLDATFDVAAMDLNKSGLVDASTGVNAVAAFKGSVHTGGNIVEATGDLRAEKVKLVPAGKPADKPIELTFDVAHDMTKRSGKLKSANIHIGKAAANLAGSYSLSGATPSFALKFKGDKMALTELASVLPALDVVLPAGSKIEAGTLTMRTDVAGSLGKFSAIGPINIEGAKLGSFDLGRQLKVIEMMAGIPSTPTTEIEKLSATVKHTPDGTLIQALDMVVTSVGTLTGSGTISASNELDFQMRTTLHTSGALMKMVGQKGDTSIPFLIGGTASNPTFKANVKQIATEKVQQLTKDPIKTIDAARDLFNMFRKPKPEDQK